MEQDDPASQGIGSKTSPGRPARSAADCPFTKVEASAVSFCDAELVTKATGAGTVLHPSAHYRVAPARHQVTGILCGRCLRWRALDQGWWGNLSLTKQV